MLDWHELTQTMQEAKIDLEKGLISKSGIRSKLFLNYMQMKTKNSDHIVVNKNNTIVYTKE